MIKIRLTNYTLASLFYWLHKFNRFNYEFNRKQAGHFKNYLTTDCEKPDICASTLFPSMRTKYPKSAISISVGVFSFFSSHLVTRKDFKNLLLLLVKCKETFRGTQKYELSVRETLEKKRYGTGS